MLGLVVAGNGNINILHRRVAVAESDGGDVTIGSLLQSLRIRAGVTDNQKTRLDELGLDLIGECTGGEATRDGADTSEVLELQDGTLSPLASRDDSDVLGVLNSNNHSGSEHKFLPSLLKVEQVCSWKISRHQQRSEKSFHTLNSHVKYTPSERRFQM